MKRTIAIKLETTKEQSAAFALLTQEFSKACNYVVPIARKNRCLSHTTLHHRAYYPTRATTKLGSQMVCNAIKLVANSFRVLNIKTTEDFPLLTFKPSTSVHFDKRTYSLQGEFLSLYTLSGRILVPMVVGDFQRDYLKRGRPKEAQLIYKNKAWFFNLVLDIPVAPKVW
jgi:predicted transposase